MLYRYCNQGGRKASPSNSTLKQVDFYKNYSIFYTTCIYLYLYCVALLLVSLVPSS